MAIAETKTLLTLDRFFRVVGLNPLHANQIFLPEGESGCGAILFQNNYQAGGRLGREEIAQAIDDAERRLAQVAGFDLFPRYVTSDEIQMPRYRVPEYDHPGWNIRGDYNNLKLPRGYVQEGGVEAWASEVTDSPIDFEDRDDDDYAEQASVVFTTFTTNPSEIALTYPASAVDDPTLWQIQPVTYVFDASAHTTTAFFRREQVVIPPLLTMFNPDEGGVDGTDDNNFLDSVDVYHHFTDKSQSVTFQWAEDCPSCVSSVSGCLACGFTEQSGCLRVTNQRQGIVSLAPGNWDAQNGNFTGTTWALQCRCRRAPDRAVVNYRAGWAWNGSLTKMDPLWERTIAYLALSLLTGPICSCVDKLHEQWSDDFLLQESGSEEARSFQIPRRGNSLWREYPLGTTRAAVYAWSNLMKVALGESVPGH